MIRLPDEWNGQGRLFDAIRDLDAKSDRTEIKPGPGPSSRIIRHPPDALITLEYTVVKDWSGRRLKDGHYARVVVTPDYLYAVGEALWITPDWPESRPVSLRLRWDGGIQNWSFRNSFGTGIDQQFQSSPAAFRHATFIGGDFRVRRLEPFGQAVYLATRDTLKFDEEDLASLVTRLARRQRSFWDEGDFPDYLVILLPTDDSVGNAGGEGRTNSFSLYIPAETTSVMDFRYTLAHEMFHAWVPQRLGKLENEELHWFSEGFTDFYAALLLLREGLITLEEYLAGYNELVEAYLTSSARSLTAHQVTKERRRSYDAERIPYQRGHLLAYRWNAAIISATRGERCLDDTMKQLRKSGKAAEAVLDERAIIDCLRPYLGNQPEMHIRKYMERGEVLPFAGDEFGLAVEVRHVERAPFELGFNRDETMGGRIFAGVVEGSNAYKSGLRNGQPWVGGGVAMVPTVLAELEVQDGDVRRTIKYYPAATQTIRLPRFSLKPGSTPAEREALLQRLGVERPR
jgi:predicted metalloprotease with PDZ domain